ncbi:MAG: hypothetical protein RM021_018450 [Nostoc sp. EkiNYC01]|nr:hypothetical protein [Nostoc sp. EkiNYC01]
MNYPEYFPDNCPPKEATVPSGEFYRFINSSHTSPQENDFLPWLREYPDRKYFVTKCQACGTSIFPSLDAVNNMLAQVPALRKKKIARGVLNSDLGKIQNTPSQNEKSHHTWWIPEASEPWKLFQMINLDKI